MNPDASKAFCAMHSPKEQEVRRIGWSLGDEVILKSARKAGEAAVRAQEVMFDDKEVEGGAAALRVVLLEDEAAEGGDGGGGQVSVSEPEMEDTCEVRFNA